MSGHDEEWRDVEGYEGLYQVSSTGRVKSLARTRKGKAGAEVPVEERILKLSTHESGYLVCSLSRGGSSAVKKVHRLVARAFLPNPDKLPSINHKDERKINNRAENLEWCTHQYNTEYSRAKNWLFKNPDGDVVLIKNLNKFCKENNLNQGVMWSVHEGEVGQHKGWRRGQMQGSWEGFTNLQCEYFPCHDDVPLDEFNCMECFCSLYFIACPGDFSRLDDGRKDCTGCSINHKAGFTKIKLSMMKRPKPDSFPRGDATVLTKYKQTD